MLALFESHNRLSIFDFKSLTVLAPVIRLISWDVTRNLDSGVVGLVAVELDNIGMVIQLLVDGRFLLYIILYKSTNKYFQCKSTIW